MKDVYIHPNALVESVNIGTGTRIWAFAHVMKGAVIGANCNVGDHVFIESGAVIGNDVTVKNQCMIWEGVTIEDGVFVGPGVSFTNDLYPRSPRLPIVQKRYSDKNIWLANTHVKYGASLGARTVILPGVEIGEFSMVGAGAVISHDVPAFALAIGNPAKWAGWVGRFCILIRPKQPAQSVKVVIVG
jgi:acetyltransferase-like isoleucine patch superfamily enzyme